MKSTQNPEQIIIFGGSFNPPTRAHEQIIDSCLSMPGFDEVWVMPSGDRDDKRLLGTDQQRLAMLDAMKDQEFGNDPRLKITDFELELPQPTQTIRTVGALALAYPGKRFWFVFGADSYASMPDWEYGEKLQKQLPMLLLPRDKLDLPNESATIRYLPDIAAMGDQVSSTKVRDTIAENGDITPFVSGAVKAFIRSNNLYAAS